MKYFLPNLFLCTLIFASSTSFSQVTEGEIELYNAEINQARNLKNENFKNPEASPLPVSDIASFTGLAYYDPDISFKVAAQLSMLEEQEIVSLKTTDGKTVDFTKYGTVSFQLQEKSYTLEVFRDQNLSELKSSPGNLFIPFTDKTSGKTTNDSGRYIALDMPQDSNEVTLDFNKAFNPYSAYNNQSISVIAPDENNLEVEVVTGERKYEDR